MTCRAFAFLRVMSDSGELYTTSRGAWVKVSAYSFGGGKPVVITIMAGESAHNTAGALIVATDSTCFARCARYCQNANEYVCCLLLRQKARCFISPRHTVALLMPGWLCLASEELLCSWAQERRTRSHSLRYRTQPLPLRLLSPSRCSQQSLRLAVSAPRELCCCVVLERRAVLMGRSVQRSAVSKQPRLQRRKIGWRWTWWPIQARVLVGRLHHATDHM